MGTRAERIEALLQQALQPARMVVTDESAQHAGHAGARAGGETHYQVQLVSPVFAGMSRVGRSRAVHTALAEEFATGLHALSLTLRAPGE
jgi:BolA protein